MSEIRKHRPPKSTRRLSLRGVILLLGLGVIFPVLLATATGIVSLSLGEGSEQLVIGVLVISFAAAAIGFSVAVTVLLGRKARLARMQTDLIDNVSHELRTPLTSIRMYAQTLQQEGGLVDKNAPHMLDTIVRETEWLESTINRMLNWRRAERDRDVLELQRGTLTDSVQRAVERFQRLLAPGEVQLEVQLKSNKSILHDPQAISTLVLNLLVNAYKYTHRNKQISLSLEDHPTGVNICVADNGIGIPQRMQKSIFEPFFRVEDGSQQGSASVGLGLAIVSHLVKAHQGVITLDSKTGKGSRFSVEIPALDK